MRRISITLSAVGVFLAGLMAVQSLDLQVAAQNDGRTSVEDQLVGTWLIDLGEEGGRLMTFSEDGIVHFNDLGGTGIGTWEAGETTSATFTIWELTTEQFEEGPSFTGFFLIAGALQINEDGSWTGDVVLAQTDREGNAQGTEGPHTITATRLPMIQTDQLAAGVPVLGSPPSATPAA